MTAKRREPERVSTERNSGRHRGRGSIARAIGSGLAVVAVTAIGWADAAEAAFCSEPVLPFCINQPAVFESDMARSRCGAEAEAFAEGMRAYARCLEEQRQEALDRAAEIEKRFRCMARGEEDCRQSGQ